MWPFTKRLVIPAGLSDAKARVIPGDSLENLVGGLGTPRDKRFHTHYRFSPSPTRDQIENMYDTSWLAGRIVSTVAHDMIRAGWKVSWDGSTKDEKSTKAISDAETAFNVIDESLQGLLWSRASGGACTIFFMRGDTLKDLSLPLEMESIKKDSLLSLVTRDRWWIAPTGQPDPNPGPNFGLPISYMLSDAGTIASTLVHWSRLVRWNGRRLPRTSWFRNGMWDGSELQPCLDSVKDYDATKAGIAAMVWEANVDVMKQSGLADLLATDEGTEKARRRFETGALMKSFNRMVLIDKDSEEFEQKTITFAGLKDVLMNFMIDVCGAADVPMTRLFGQSAAGISATGEFDMKNYHEHISAKQKSHLWRNLMRIYEVVIRSTLGFFPENFAIDFNPLQEMTDKEESEILLNRAKAAQIYMAEGAVPEHVITRDLKDRGTYDLTDEDVALVKKTAVAMPPAPLPLPSARKPPATGAPPAAKPVPAAA